MCVHVRVRAGQQLYLSMACIDQCFWLGVATRSHDRNDDDDVDSRHASGSHDSGATLETDVVGKVASELFSILNLTVSKFIKFIP